MINYQEIVEFSKWAYSFSKTYKELNNDFESKLNEIKKQIIANLKKKPDYWVNFRENLYNELSLESKRVFEECLEKHLGKKDNIVYISPKICVTLTPSFVLEDIKICVNLKTIEKIPSFFISFNFDRIVTYIKDLEKQNVYTLLVALFAKNIFDIFRDNKDYLSKLERAYDVLRYIICSFILDCYVLDYPSIPKTIKSLPPEHLAKVTFFSVFIAYHEVYNYLSRLSVSEGTYKHVLRNLIKKIISKQYVFCV